MQGMVLAMTMGMKVGLTSGVLFGTLLQGNLYTSTIISISIGTIAGIGSGISLGLLPSIEGFMAGFMAGLMGGMMGAMLGEMATNDQADTLLKALLTLTICSLLLFKIFSSSENSISQKRWYLKPILTFIFLSTFLIIGNSLDKNVTFGNLLMSKKDPSTHTKHGTPTNNLVQRAILTITESAFSYSPPKLVIKKNEPVTLILNNIDSVEHDIEIKGLPYTQTIDNNSIEAHSKHNNGRVHLHTEANTNQEFKFTPLKEGTYTFYCTVPGHVDRGMTGELIVTQ